MTAPSRSEPFPALLSTASCYFSPAVGLMAPALGSPCFGAKRNDFAIPHRRNQLALFCQAYHPIETKGFPGSLRISRLLCGGREGSEKLPDSLEIRFRNPVERHANSESRCAVGDLAIRPALGFPDPDTHFQLRSRRQWDRHFNVTSADTEI